MDTFTTRNPFSWRIGLHNTTNPCTLETLQPHGYDFSTTPITSAAFHSRVLALLSSHLSQSAQSPTNSPTPLPTISPLSAADALLRPSPRLSSLVALVSPWIDLSSADPLIASLSRQVLVLEAGHAAFCGVGTLLVPGPEPGLEVGAGAGGEEEAGGGGGGVGRVPRLLAYARCLRDVLGGAVCMQVLVRLPAGAVGGVSALEQIGSLAPFARPQFGGGKRASVMLDDVGGGGAGEVDAMDVWDSWNFVRDVCGYHARLGIGECPSCIPCFSDGLLPPCKGLGSVKSNIRWVYTSSASSPSPAYRDQ